MSPQEPHPPHIFLYTYSLFKRLREINSELWAKAEEHRKNDCKSEGTVKHYIVMIRIEGDVIFRVGGIATDFSQTDKINEIKTLTGDDYLALINK